MFVSTSYLGGFANKYDPANPNYEENIHRLAEFNPRHPEVQKYRQRLAGEQEQEMREEMLDELQSDPSLTKEDLAAVDEMLKMAKEGDAASKDPDLTADDEASVQEFLEMVEGPRS